MKNKKNEEISKKNIPQFILTHNFLVITLNIVNSWVLSYYFQVILKICAREILSLARERERREFSAELSHENVFSYFDDSIFPHNAAAAAQENGTHNENVKLRYMLMENAIKHEFCSRQRVKMPNENFAVISSTCLVLVGSK